MESGQQPASTKLLSLAVHEFRTPLTVVAGYLRMLLRDRAGPLTTEQRKLLEEAERSCGKLGRLVSELSDLAGLDAGTATFNRGDVEIFQLVDEFAHQLAGESPSPGQIELRSPPATGIVHGDPLRLRQSLAAIHSAIQREIIGGPLVIDRRALDVPAGAVARIVVGDETTARILSATPVEEHATFDAWRGGNGLALIVAKYVIEAHGGRIYSTLGDHARTGAAIVLPLQTRPTA